MAIQIQPQGLAAVPSTGEQIELLKQRVSSLEAKLAALVKPDGSITLESNRKVEIKVGGNTLVVDSAGIALRGNGRLELANSQKVVLVSSVVSMSTSLAEMNTGMVKCTGMLKADTVQATNVIAANYTPGAGNIW